jgi:hypothetical protein
MRKTALKFAAYCGATLSYIYLLNKMSRHDREACLFLTTLAIINKYKDYREAQSFREMERALRLLTQQFNNIMAIVEGLPNQNNHAPIEPSSPRSGA